MHSEMLEDYVKQAQNLSRRLDKEPGALQELLHSIECSKDKANSEKALQEFFKGEYAFYNGHYEKALKHYLDAKGITHFEFYCFRASAHVSKMQGQYDKAITFIKKSLDIFPEDYPSVLLLADLLKQTGQHQEAQQYLAKARALADTCQKIVVTEEKEDKIPLGNREMEELAGIFFSNPPEVELFCEEPSHYCCPPQTSNQKEHLDQSECELEDAIGSFHETHNQRLNEYIQRWQKREEIPSYCLHLLHGWEKETCDEFSLSKMTEGARRPTGGFYLRWENQGIAINPGKNFLKNLHRAGLSVMDIDYVIVTDEDSAAYADTLDIFDLTHQLNKMGRHFHLIRYYLSVKAFKELSPKLQPHFKQEKETIHRLDIYIDSPEVEKIELSDQIRLNYFSTSPKSISYTEQTGAHSSSIGIRLELMGKEKAFNIGYVSGMSWSPLLSQHLAPCDLLIAGIGNTNSSDYDKMTYVDHELGYFGVASLAEEVNPKLLICSEFSGKEGDIRLEVIRKMRRECKGTSSTLLPGDLGMVILLPEMKIRCCVSDEFVDYRHIHVVRSRGAFSPLNYVAPMCCL